MDQNEFDEPTENDKELTSFVVNHCDRWRDWRDTNYLPNYLEYERIFRGEWAAEDKTRDSERSRIVTPATQQAVETRHAEIMEAIFGQGDFFDIEDDLKDVNGNPLDVEMLKAQLMEDFKQDKIRKAIDQIELMAEIYGTGIGEIVVKTDKIFEPATQAIPGQMGQAAIGVVEKSRIAVKITPVNPKNFLFDPNGTSIDDCMGVAIEKFVSIHKVVEGIEKGIYRKVNITTGDEDTDLEPTQEVSQYRDEKVKLLTYYGLVPREYLAEKDVEVEVLFPEDSAAEDYSDMVEAIVVIANDGMLLKAEENPYMMKDRPVLAYQDDTVPNRLLGRGTVEKSYNMQKAIDAQVRSHLDSLALTTSPMIGLDASRLPRGAKFEVKPGKAFMVNGNPSEILYPFKFGETSLNNLNTAKEFERMLLQATGTMDSQGMVSQGNRDGAGMSMAVATIIKKYKRTLVNFQEDFLIPFIQKAAFRFMQFDPERYPSVDMKFIPTATLGIIAREYEQQQFISLLQTLGPNTPVLPLILKGILGNSSLSNRFELIGALDQMSQPNPEAQQLQQAQQQLALQAAQAQIAVSTTQAEQNRAEAQKLSVETQLMPQEVQAKVLASATKNLPQGNESNEFDKRVKIAELMLKEADIKNKSKIVELQMNNAKSSVVDMENDFLETLNTELRNGNR
ncbi:hypothetical protein UFOVP626_33 [uncultured Caudovirales phage]|uniref:Portal protein n=1 Tax=uncultured Caudovirales phage TaxID=2100421 RepID=A0A6J5N2L6_9CAUD|nr:hypothetical protein UFOVP626_33 [uncultured Caudovirales phage]CAB4173105.1 hypothetical protein UFOVP951_28 [uncultured Caudovirales phage]CAB4184411.1 hypothetical protein UFOVP1115_3 [uncultured Caudovirales phage]CAB4204203.1 hypothetical protein UFOVP1390_39 [uncultured Caudovirales phage]CAB5238188.1 hypothetical protein UFOVP1567_2 [uncultured Caudovirales phage]